MILWNFFFFLCGESIFGLFDVRVVSSINSSLSPENFFVDVVVFVCFKPPEAISSGLLLC